MMIPFLMVLDVADALGVRQYLSPSEGVPMNAVMTITSALICAFVFGIARNLGYSRKTALKVAALVGFGSILWALSRQSFDMVPEAMGVIGAYYFVITAQKSGERRWLHCLAAGLLYGVALITRVSTVMAAPGLVLLVLGSKSWGSPRERVKAALWCAAGGLALGWWIPFYNYLRFNDVLEFGYTGHGPYTGGSVLEGLALWLVSPWQGTTIYMPVLLALPVVWRRFSRRHGVVIWSFVLGFAAYLAFHAQYTGLGATGWGPYYLLPGILPLYLLFAELFENPRGFPAWQRGIAYALIALTVAIQVPALSLPPERIQSSLVAARPGLTHDQLRWSLEWWPVRKQLEGTLTVIGNLPHWRDFLDSPSNYEDPTLLRELFAYNLPDWWWAYRLAHGGQLGLVVPFFSGLCAIWLLTRRFAADNEGSTQPQVGESEPVRMP
jgi:hypothetical protein